MAGISITIGGNFTKLDELKTRANKTADSIRSAFGSKLARSMFAGIAAAGAAAFAGVAVAAKKAVSDASDLAEVMSKTKVVFGASADQMIEWAATASRTFGQSKQQALDAASGFGNLFVAMGLVGPVAANMSRTLTELASDLASFNNTSVEDAILAIGSALRGEMEPMTRFGVLLNDATLKAKALAMGLSDGKETLGPAIKAQAAYALMLEQTSTAQGDFARTSDGLANSQRTIAALFEDLSASVGEQLLPTMQQFAATIKEMDFQQIGNGIKGLIGYMGSLAEASGNVMKALTPIVDAIDWATSAFVSAPFHNLGYLQTSLALGEQPAYRPPSKPTTPEAPAQRSVFGIPASLAAPKSTMKGDESPGAKAAIAIFAEIEQEQKAAADKSKALAEVKAALAEQELQNAKSILEGKLSDVNNRIASQQFESTIGAATSMQRIGGGGGAVSSGLDYARQTAELQREANDLTRQLIAIMKPEPSV